MSKPSIFNVLRQSQRIWAIASIHVEVNRINRLQTIIRDKFIPGDRLLYLGNILGRGENVKGTVDAILAFRRDILSRRNMFVHDIVMLRGAQEEMWQRLMQLQFSINPTEVLEWMLYQGIGSTLEAYGSSAEDAQSAIRQGPIAITRWTTKIRTAFQAAGHQEWLSSLKHAAWTSEGTVLFVNRGIDPERPLDAQADVFWWGGRSFATINTAYKGFGKIVRGFDPTAKGLAETQFTISIDGGCGRGGPLLAVCLNNEGKLINYIEV